MATSGTALGTGVVGSKHWMIVGQVRGSHATARRPQEHRQFCMCLPAARAQLGAYDTLTRCVRKPADARLNPLRHGKRLSDLRFACFQAQEQVSHRRDGTGRLGQVRIEVQFHVEVSGSFALREGEEINKINGLRNS